MPVISGTIEEDQQISFESTSQKQKAAYALIEDLQQINQILLPVKFRNFFTRIGGKINNMNLHESNLERLIFEECKPSIWQRWKNADTTALDETLSTVDYHIGVIYDEIVSKTDTLNLSSISLIKGKIAILYQAATNLRANMKIPARQIALMEELQNILCEDDEITDNYKRNH